MSKFGFLPISFSLAVAVVALASCTHAPAEDHKADDAVIAQYTRGDAENQLARTMKDLDKVDEKIRTASSRRDNYQLQANSDPNKRSAVEGSEAELEALQTKRGNLLHRQHAIEARLRELGVGENDEDQIVLPAEPDSKGNRPD
jgi:hypothetical protein